MNIVIIEDEGPAARRLEKMIKEMDSTMKILARLDSIEASIAWFGENPQPDLAFMDIELADGQSFEIFNQVKISCPVIFTTAYDEFALKAFAVNSIDYLLKPIEEASLRKAIQKLDDLRLHLGTASVNVDINQLIKVLRQPQQTKNRFLIKHGERLIPIEKEQIAYFVSEDKLSFIITHDHKKYVIDHTMDELEHMADPHMFFRLNRQFIANIKSIVSIHHYFNGKLKLTLKPDTQEEVIVSRDKAPVFKSWLNA